MYLTNYADRPCDPFSIATSINDTLFRKGKRQTRLHFHLLADERLGQLVVILGVVDDDSIRDRRRRTSATLGVVVKHYLNLHTDGTLAEQGVASAGDNVLVDRVTGRDHVAILELHCLRTLAAELTRDANFRTLGAGFHDVTKDTIARTVHERKSR